MTRYIVTVWIDHPLALTPWEIRMIYKRQAESPEVLKAEIMDVMMRNHGVDVGVEFGPVSETGWGK